MFKYSFLFLYIPNTNNGGGGNHGGDGTININLQEMATLTSKAAAEACPASEEAKETDPISGTPIFCVSGNFEPPFHYARDFVSVQTGWGRARPFRVRASDGMGGYQLRRGWETNNQHVAYCGPAETLAALIVTIEKKLGIPSACQLILYRDPEKNFLHHLWPTTKSAFYERPPYPMKEETTLAKLHEELGQDVCDLYLMVICPEQLGLADQGGTEWWDKYYTPSI